MISSEVISDFIGTLPAIKITEPYSPSARANASAKPVNKAGNTAGSTTRRNVSQREAPRHAAASSCSRSNSSSTGCTVRTTNGKPIKVSAISTPAGVKAILMPSGSRNCPIQPLPAYTAASEMPATEVGSANGRSTTASTMRLNGKV